MPELGARDLVFFRRAGYYRNDVQIFGLDVMLFAIVRFEHRREHLLRGFARGYVGENFGIIVLGKLNPAGAAAREHGRCAAVFEPV